MKVGDIFIVKGGRVKSYREGRSVTVTSSSMVWVNPGDEAPDLRQYAEALYNWYAMTSQNVQFTRLSTSDSVPIDERITLDEMQVIAQDPQRTVGYDTERDSFSKRSRLIVSKVSGFCTTT